MTTPSALLALDLPTPDTDTTPLAATQLPPGLTPQDAQRITAAIAAARSQSTRKIYAGLWRHWEQWCTARGATPLPADSLLIAAFLIDRADAGLAIGTLNGYCSVIRTVHRLCGASDPLEAEVVKEVRRGLVRTYGGPRRLARALTVAEITAIVTAIDRTTTYGLRDAAMILLGFASALRRCELVGLDLADVEHHAAGLLLTVRTSKTDTESEGQRVAVTHGENPLTDPVAALDAWLAVRGTAPGPLFTRIWGPTVSLKPITGYTLARVLRVHAQVAGLDATRITPHSLRAGHATSAALAGVPLDRIAAQTRHKSLEVLIKNYIRPHNVFGATSSKDLGL